MLTQKELKKLLIFDRFTGKFYWKVSRGGAQIGDEAGWRSDGYIRISVLGIDYKAHRLSWLYEYGYLPEMHIDHIDRARCNNRISNLREITPLGNSRNNSTRSDNTSGIVGIGWDTSSDSWRVRITLTGKAIYLGRFKDFTEAVAHRLSAEDCLDWHLSDANTSARQYMKEYLESLK